MAPSEKKLKEELQAEVRTVLASAQRDELTVNYIRQHVAEKLDLDSDFFKQGDWKTLSKDVIHEAVVRVPIFIWFICIWSICA